MVWLIRFLIARGPRRENGTVQNVLKRNASIKQSLREVKHRSMIVVKRSMSTVLLAEHGKEKMYKLLTDSKDIKSKEKLNGSQEMASGKQLLRYTWPLVFMGVAFGAKRWVSTLKHQCERHASAMESNIPSGEKGENPHPKATSSKWVQLSISSHNRGENEELVVSS
ncbi:Homeobox-leucine zipper protein ROC1 [Carex littledalei]|uniref:Homeobox-leucine zipper protein ROC1 n=1 Tax=Carex littledalei TaxID=544730 RepID=A0A833VFB1_9POAL|nr:Homeobox-leucine zipper protein ROC1 [Carex littledalei]